MGKSPFNKEERIIIDGAIKKWMELFDYAIIKPVPNPGEYEKDKEEIKKELKKFVKKNSMKIFDEEYLYEHLDEIKSQIEEARNTLYSEDGHI